MRYKSIELINYIGFYNGMGLNSIKIDFTKCKSNKIIIRGSNGSGKSTLMNAINPNPDTNDKFIPNAEARKTIVLSDNGIDYLIRYIHPITNSGRGTTKGYIAKMIDGNMVELNPNGNVSSCKEILYSEFNLDSNYLSLSALSSEDRGLVDSRPAERKKLVNSIIHTLETYNQIYKKISKKVSIYKETINSITHKINDLGNETTLQISLQNTQNRLTKLEEERDITIEAIAGVKIRINDYMNILKENNYDNIVSELKEITSELKSLDLSINKQLLSLGISDIDKIDDFSNYVSCQLNEYRADLKAIESTILVLLTQRENEASTLEDRRQKLDSLQSKCNITELMNSIKTIQADVDEIEKVFSQMKMKNINLITKDEFDTAMDSLYYLRDTAMAVISNYNYNTIYETITNPNGVKTIIDNIPYHQKQITDDQNERATLLTKVAIYRTQSELAAELSNRPKDCIIDDCPYIATALKASRDYPVGELEAMLERISELEKDIEEHNLAIINANTFKEANEYIENIRRSLKSNMKFIKKLPVRDDFEQTFFERVLNNDLFEDIEYLYNFVDCGNMLERYKVETEQLRIYISEYKIYEEKEKTVNDLVDSISILNNKIDNISNAISTNNAKADELRRNITGLENAEVKIKSLVSIIKESLEPLKIRESELTSIKENLDFNTSELTTLESQLGELNKNLGAVNSDIRVLTDEKERINHAIIMLNDYKVELQQYQDKYVKMEKIRYYSSSSTGIQTLYMQLYMNKIITTANELLSLLFDGEFMLQPFVINESEFRIPCLGNGLLHDDISSMSTAQKSMISLILSFSILHQSATRYNVIFLDELDGGLDTSNRSYFITLLDRLMQMLACEQCFIISHNNELNTANADLIVLKSNPNDQYSGNIIWKY